MYVLDKSRVISMYCVCSVKWEAIYTVYIHMYTCIHNTYPYICMYWAYHVLFLCIVCVLTNETRYAQYMYTCIHARMYVLGILRVYMYTYIHNTYPYIYMYWAYRVLFVCTACVLSNETQYSQFIYTCIHVYITHAHVYVLGISRVYMYTCTVTHRLTVTVTCIHVYIIQSHVYIYCDFTFIHMIWPIHTYGHVLCIHVHIYGDSKNQSDG